MKKIWLLMMLIYVVTLSACGSSDDYNQLLTGTWYHEGSTSPAFTLYDDGTCEIAGEYGEGTWEIDENNQLILYNYYGESEMAPIISVEDGCLSIGDESEVIVLYNEPTSNNNSSDMPLNESDDTMEEEITNEYAESIEQEKEEILAQEVYYLDTKYTNYMEMTEIAVLCSYETYADNTSEYLGIINDELKFIPCTLEYSSDYSGFSDGYAYINYDNSYFLIIDTEGNVVYKSPSDAAYKILCGGNGHYYVEKKVSGFDINEVSYWIISVDGNWSAVDFVSDIDYTDYQYQGNGILQLGEFVFVNMEDCSTYYTSSSDKYKPQFVGFTEDGKLIWLHTTSYRGEIYITDINNNTIQIATTGGWGSAKYSEGLIFVGDNDGQGKFIDIEGNVVIDLSQYKITDFETGCQFKEGYAALNIIGQDGLDYLAIIDKSGSFVFDPIQFTSYSNMRGIGKFSNGFIPIVKRVEDGEGLNHYVHIVDCSGNISKVFQESNNLGFLVCVDNLIFNSYEVKFYDMNGKECPITIAN